MIRLQSELSTAMSLANEVLSREKIKQQVALEGKGMWQKRFVLVDMKRKFPTLGTKEDEELFQDRERVPKKIKTDISGYVRHTLDTFYTSHIIIQPPTPQATYSSGFWGLRYSNGCGADDEAKGSYGYDPDADRGGDAEAQRPPLGRCGRREFISLK